MIETTRLHIVPFSTQHLTARYVAWLNDPEVVKYSEQRHRTHTLASCRAYWQSFQDTPNFFWALVTRDSSPGFIGTMTTYRDEPNGLADMGILIGERGAWGKGLGLEAWEAMCRYLFEEIGVRKITAGTVAENKAMLAIMTKAGMMPDGVRKKHYLLMGKPTDVVHMALFNPKILNPND